MSREPAFDVTANDVVAFVVEVAAVVVLAMWGYGLGSAGAAKVLLAVAVPALAIALWACFAAPRAVFRVPAAAVAVKVIVLGGAALASFAVLPLGWAIAFALVVVVNTALTWVGPFAR